MFSKNILDKLPTDGILYYYFLLLLFLFSYKILFFSTRINGEKVYYRIVKFWMPVHVFREINYSFHLTRTIYCIYIYKRVPRLGYMFVSLRVDDPWNLSKQISDCQCTSNKYKLHHIHYVPRGTNINSIHWISSVYF